jgi:anti-anti-sigma factor
VVEVDEFTSEADVGVTKLSPVAPQPSRERAVGDAASITQAEESELQLLTRERDGLKAAMETRAVIEQAKGVIMAATHCDADRAFDLLREQSQYLNRKLREVAADIVADIVRSSEPGSSWVTAEPTNTEDDANTSPTYVEGARVEQAGTAAAIATCSRGERPNVVVVTGQIDELTKPLLATAIGEARAEGWLALEIDLAGVSFLGSAGISVLIAAYETEPVGGIRVINPSPVARRVLEITGLADPFDVH